MKKRYYAIKENPSRPDTVGIYEAPWVEVEKIVKGCRGAKYKGFTSITEAEAYMNEPPTPEWFEEDEIDYPAAFTDGSYNKAENKVGWATVILKSKYSEPILVSGNTENPFWTDSWNVSGELLACAQAISTAYDAKIMRLTIYADYIEAVEIGEGRHAAKNKATRRYSDFISKARDAGMKISFVKVKAHDGIEWNEVVDKAAKKACGIKTA